MKIPDKRQAALWWHRNSRRLCIGDGISQLGSQVSYLAIPLIAVNTLRASPFQVGVLQSAGFAAFLVVGLPAGAWLDRMRRRPVMILTDGVRALTLAVLAMLALFDSLSLTFLCFWLLLSPLPLDEPLHGSFLKNADPPLRANARAPEPAPVHPPLARGS